MGLEGIVSKQLGLRFAPAAPAPDYAVAPTEPPALPVRNGLGCRRFDLRGRSRTNACLLGSGHGYVLVAVVLAIWIAITFKFFSIASTTKSSTNYATSTEYTS
jgi:hypothetical protein